MSLTINPSPIGRTSGSTAIHRGTRWTGFRRKSIHGKENRFHPRRGARLDGVEGAKAGATRDGQENSRRAACDPLILLLEAHPIRPKPGSSARRRRRVQKKWHFPLISQIAHVILERTRSFAELRGSVG